MVPTKLSSSTIESSSSAAGLGCGATTIGSVPNNTGPDSWGGGVCSTTDRSLSKSKMITSGLGILLKSYQNVDFR